MGSKGHKLLCIPFFIASIATVLPTFMALLLFWNPSRLIAYPMSLPDLKLLIILLASRAESSTPELTPRPAMG